MIVIKQYVVYLSESSHTRRLLKLHGLSSISGRRLTMLKGAVVDPMDKLLEAIMSLPWWRALLKRAFVDALDQFLKANGFDMLDWAYFMTDKSS